MMIAFAIACLATYFVNAAAAGREKPNYVDAVGISVLLCVSYGIGNLAVAAYGMPTAALLFPIFDAIFAYMVWKAWKRTGHSWKLIISGLLVSQLTMHTGLILAWGDGNLTASGLNVYILLLNVAFTLQLLTVGSVGASFWVTRFVRWMSSSGGSPVRAYAKWK